MKQKVWDIKFYCVLTPHTGQNLKLAHVKGDKVTHHEET